jgi:hypothetical protein
MKVAAASRRPDHVSEAALTGASWTLALALMAYAVCVALNVLGRHLAHELSADITFIYNVYLDIFRDHYPAFGLKVAASPNLFPDAAVLFPLIALTGSMGRAFAAYYALHLVALFAVAVALGRRIRPASKRAVIAPAVVLAAFATLGRELYFLWLFPGMHGDVILCFLVGALAALRARDGELDGWRALVFVAFGALVGFSDYLGLAVILAPLAATALHSAWLRRGTAKRHDARLLALLAAAIGGTFALRIGFDALAIVEVPASGAAPSRLDLVRASLRHLPQIVGVARSYSQSMTAIAIAALAAITLAARWRRVAADESAGAAAWRWIARATSLSVAANLAALVAGAFLSDAIVDTYKLRYFESALALPVLVAGIAMPLLDRPLARGLQSLATLTIVTMCLRQAPAELGKLAQRTSFDIYPEIVACVDRVAAARGLHDGYGDFDSEHFLQAFSRRGVRVLDFGPEKLVLGYWAKNSLWSFRPDASAGTLRLVRPTFAVTLYPDQIVERFGEPAARTDCERYTVLVYDRPADVAFRNATRRYVELQMRAPGALGTTSVAVESSPTGARIVLAGGPTRRPILDVAMAGRGPIEVVYLLGGREVGRDELERDGRKVRRELLVTPGFAGRDFDEVRFDARPGAELTLTNALLIDDRFDIAVVPTRGWAHRRGGPAQPLVRPL